ncbi:YtpR family tRNA-binding protein [Liquorilactobacillus capillatus]|uniref:tRNA-binding domain-containing protein n=1 Tax=Liquorilactobacillus capillatus DSM 19910 TaxID=1423731 RepID=A0A0R1M503_9LACO|nr:DUF4479 and tRNA-binding domain-containing protein [Liquorilactobacillus capillatus]KRL03191.1 tRNA-binding domain-containing protein [Liquorilactobacillus capillatus DSM 19910]
MVIASYNPNVWGDILVTVVHADAKQQKVEKRGKIICIKNADDGTILGFNFLDASKMVKGLAGQGQVILNGEQLMALNSILMKAGFEYKLIADEAPKFVVGFVEELSKHPNSDHLHITKTRVDNGELLQIVCGAPNIAQGQLVVVAKNGAFMPDGQVIWPGELRGVKSDGMICSARELNLPNAPAKKGILVLDPDKYTTGLEFNLRN